MRLKNKVAIVTGGASGIGNKTVERFLGEGAKVIVTDINEESGKMALNEWKQKYANICFFQHDVQKETDWEWIVQETKAIFGRIDILFNNAGIYKSGLITNYTLDDWNLLMGVNVTGVFLGMKHVVPAMIKQQEGSIINASSIAGIVGTSGHALYGASKGAVRTMTKDVAIEVAQYNIRVNSIHPGVIQTSMGEALANSVNLSEKQLAEVVPLQRLGTPKNVSDMVLFLASDESSYITGAEMVIDGGMVSD